jgi:hypothetical protein
MAPEADFSTDFSDFGEAPEAGAAEEHEGRTQVTNPNPLSFVSVVA